MAIYSISMSLFEACGTYEVVVN